MFPSPQKQGGGGTLAGGWGVGGSPNSDEGHTLWYSLYVRTLWQIHSPYFISTLYVLCGTEHRNQKEKQDGARARDVRAKRNGVNGSGTLPRSRTEIKIGARTGSRKGTRDWKKAWLEEQEQEWKVMGTGMGRTGRFAPVLPTLGKTFRPVRRKNSAAKKKNLPPTKFDFLKAFGLMKILYFWIFLWYAQN